MPEHDATPARQACAGGRPGPFGWLDFVIVDVETTGWTPGEAEITEIGAVRMTGGRVRDVFSYLVNPGCLIPAAITTLTGITQPLVAAAPPVSAVLPGFLSFARGCVLTAHNAPFDLGFLTAACQASGLAWPDFPVLDTAELARSLLGPDEVPDRKLRTLAQYFRTAASPRHRALADALATADVLECLLRRAAAAGMQTLAAILPPTGDTLSPDGERTREAPSDHRDRAGPGGCGQDPGDRRGNCPDPAGQ